METIGPKYIKPCSVCKIEFAPALFHKSKKYASGYSYRCRDCDKAARKTYKDKNKERFSLLARKKQLKYRYNLTLDQYSEILKSQNDCCAICLDSAPRLRENYKTSFVVDHNHRTGKIRGLICSNCNRGIGFLGDNLDNFTRAYEYIKRGET